MVGDFAIFMVQNELTPENILDKGKNLDYPDSVMTYFRGMMGQPYGGFPKDLQDMILKGDAWHLLYLSHAFEEIQLSGNQSVISERKPGAYREIYIITDEYWER